MKSILTFFSLLLGLFCVPQMLFAQEENKEIRAEETFYQMKGSHEFNIGMGYPNLAVTALDVANIVGVSNDAKSTPNFTLKYEYGLVQDVGIGLHLGYYSAKMPSFTGLVQDIDFSGVNEILCSTLGISCPDTTVTSSISYDRVHAVTIGGRFAYHRKVLENLDIYGSTVFGYSIIKKKTIGEPNASNENFAGQLPTFVYFAGAGARYYISPNWGVYGELGYGALTVFNAGVTYRIL